MSAEQNTKNRIALLTDGPNSSLEEGLALLTQREDFKLEFSGIDFLHTDPQQALEAGHDIVIAAVGVPHNTRYEESVNHLLDSWKKASHRPVLLLSTVDIDATTKVVNSWKLKNPLFDTGIKVVEQKKITDKEQLKYALRSTDMIFESGRPSAYVSYPRITALQLPELSRK